MSLEDQPQGPCGTVGSNEKICDCLSCALKPITAAILTITDALNRRQAAACDLSDDCIDKIYEKIKQKVEGPLYSCEKCKTMLSNGMGGTLEYAVRCAHNACDECVDSCGNPNDPLNEGKCCKTCEGANCTCRGGLCKPSESEPEGKDKKWVGWCHLETGVIAVTKQGEFPPSPGYKEVGIAYSELAALELAKSNCKWRNENLPPLPGIPGGGKVGLICDIDSYFNGIASNMLNVAAVAANMASGSAQAHEAVARIGIEGFNAGTIGSVAMGLVRSFMGFDPVMAQDLTPLLAKSIGCGDPQFQETFKAIAAISQASRYLGVDAEPFLTQHYYAMNAVCRQKQLGPDEAMAAYLADNTNQFPIDQHFAIAGICNEALQWKLQASRSKPIPLQLAMARRRKLIDANAYDSGMRELGYIDGRNPGLLYELTEQRPPMSEIIRYMVRDTDDEGLVREFGLDDQFTNKYQSQLKQWAEDQGISDQQMKYSWRAHWTIPSPGQLFTFYHRLRYKQQFGGQSKLLDDIKKALVQQDILPFWHEHFLAVSFRPMRLVDIRRSFQIGSLDEADLIPAYLDLGYADETADKMKKFTIRLRDRAAQSERGVKLWLSGAITRDAASGLLRNDGFPQTVIDAALAAVEPNFDKSVFARAFVRGDISRKQLLDALSGQGVSSSAADKIANKLSYLLTNHTALDDYQAGIVERSAARQTMQTSGFNPAIADKQLDKIDHALRLQHIKRCMSGIKRQFLLGEIDASDAQSLLVQRGVTVPRANDEVDWWRCELSSGEKDVSLATLCEWLTRGAISPTQYLQRLETLGYSNTDAALLLEDCLIRANVKATAKELQEAKANSAAQAKLSRALNSAARQQSQYLARLESARIAAAKNRRLREKSLLSAAAILTPKCECELIDALDYVKRANKDLVEKYAMSIDRTLQILNLAALEYQGGPLNDFLIIADKMAEVAVSANYDGSKEQFPSNGITSGVT